MGGGQNRNTHARRVALTGLLFALALALSFLESQITPLLGLPPGVKIGLANVVVLYALLFATRRQALLLVLLKAGFALLSAAGMLSLAGGLLSVVMMMLLLLPRLHASVWLVSAAGAVCHNMGQLLAVRLWMGPFALYYTPVLLLAGLAMGSLNALLLRALLPALEKAGLTQR